MRRPRLRPFRNPDALQGCGGAGNVALQPRVVSRVELASCLLRTVASFFLRSLEQQPNDDDNKKQLLVETVAPLRQLTDKGRRMRSLTCCVAFALRLLLKKTCSLLASRVAKKRYVRVHSTVVYGDEMGRILHLASFRRTTPEILFSRDLGPLSSGLLAFALLHKMLLTLRSTSRH